MPTARVSEISATSTISFDDAIQHGLARAHKTLRNVRGAWIKEQLFRMEDGVPSQFQVYLMVTFDGDD